MNDTIKMFIGNEEVVCSNEFTINKEMLSASSTILNNCYPESWELTKDYVSNFYYPEDYSKFIIGKGNYQYGTTEYGVVEASGEQPTYETNVEKEWNKFNIWGNTYQATRSGKNLANIESIQIGKSWSNTSVTSRATILYIPVKINTRYTLAFTFTNTHITNIRSVFNHGPSDTTNNAVPPSYPYLNESWEYVSIEILADTTFTSAMLEGVKILFCEGNATIDDYEPYGVMPSPDYPSELESVGYTNLFNKNNVNVFNAYINGSGMIIANSPDRTIWLPIKQNTNYAFQMTQQALTTSQSPDDCRIALFVNQPALNTTGTVVYSRTRISPVRNYTYETTFNSGSNNYVAIKILNNTKSDYNTTLDTIQLTEGTKQYPYINYGKYCIEVKVIGKNIFDEQYENGTINTNTGVTESSSSIIRTKNFQSIKSSQDYTLILPNEVTGIIIYYYNNGTYINYQQPTISNHKVSFTTRANSNQIKWRFNSGYTTLNNQTMLYEGTQATTYEPYQSNSQLYVLNEPLRAVGNVKDTMQVENGIMTITRNIGSVILNGSENFSGYAFGNYYRYSVSKSSLGIDILNNSILLSNYFYNDANALVSANCEPGMFYYAATYSNIYFITTETTANNFKNWLNTHNTEVIYQLETPTTQTIQPVNIPSSYEGINNVYLDTGAITTGIELYYYWKNYDILFSGIVKNTGNISLNPREPHYCSLQVLDYKTFLSESDTLDFVISNKTIAEAIQMVVNAVSGYGFVLGDINISQANDIIGAYSTLNQTAYDVFQYLANISGSRWRTRYIDSNTMAVDFYDPDLLPQANDIEYNQQYYEDNNIIDISFSYGTRDYRNKQIVLSDEIYGDINYTENIYADGYQTTFLLQENIGAIISIEVNGISQEVITKEEKDNGVDGDFWYTPGKNTIDSKKTLSVNSEIVVVYTPLIKGRQIVYNSDEVQRVATNTDTIGIISRYETRNDILSSQELNQVGQTYIDYKGKAEVLLNVKTQEKDLFNIGEVAFFNAPINELQQNYMVKTKNIEYIVINGTPTLFYEYQLTSSYNNEKAINYFDNQRNKAQGNIQLGDTITRNIDIENSATIIWQNLTITEVSIEPTNNNTLNMPLNSPFVE